MTFILSLFVPLLSFYCLGKAVLRNCDISFIDVFSFNVLVVHVVKIYLLLSLLPFSLTSLFVQQPTVCGQVMVPALPGIQLGPHNSRESLFTALHLEESVIVPHWVASP